MVEPLFTREFSTVPVSGENIVLGGSEGKHAATVRRMRVGEAIQLTNGKGLRVRGAVVEVGQKDLTVEVHEAKQESLPELQFVLVQALAKGDRDELAIQAATELGATEIFPWQAERSISRWDAAKAEKGRARWQVICDEAAKQSLRSYYPKVEPVVSTTGLTDLIGQFDHVLVLDPTAEDGLLSQSVTSGRVALVVGPEGGIEEQELLVLAKAGAKRVHLGSGILRTSTAGVAAISAILAASGHFN